MLIFCIYNNNGPASFVNMKSLRNATPINGSKKRIANCSINTYITLINICINISHWVTDKFEAAYVRNLMSEMCITNNCVGQTIRLD